MTTGNDNHSGLSQPRRPEAGTSQPTNEASERPADWDALGEWLQQRVGTADRRYRYAKAYASLLSQNAEPTARQRQQAQVIWSAASQDGFLLHPRGTAGQTSVEPSGGPQALDTMVPNLGRGLEIPQETRWANLTAALENAISTLPAKTLFALWLASDRRVPQNDGLSYVVETRLDSRSIRLRCIGPNHLAAAAQLPSDAQARLRETGWTEHRDPRRLLRQPDLDRDDAGIAEAARRMVDVMRTVYGADDPADLYVEVHDELRPIALGLFGGLTVLPPEHFGVEVVAHDDKVGGSGPTPGARFERQRSEPIAAYGRSAATGAWDEQALVAWCAKRLAGAVEVTWRPSDEFDLHVASHRLSPRGGIDPVALDIGKEGLVLSICWPKPEDRMHLPPEGIRRKAIYIRNAALDRDRQLNYRFRRDTRFSGTVFDGVSLFGVVPSHDASLSELDRKFDMLSEAADLLTEDELWEMGVWRPTAQ